MQRNAMRVFALALPLVLAVAACGGGDDNGSAEADQPATTAGAPTTIPASTTPSTS